MMTAIVILNCPNPKWQHRNVRRFVNPDIYGLEIESDHIRIRESSNAPSQTIDKSVIEAITIIFTKDKHE